MHKVTASVCAIFATFAMLVPSSAAQAQERNPVIFVHGFAGSGSSWNDMISDFRDDGWPADRLLAFSYNSALSNQTIAQQLSEEVDSVLSQTRASEVDIVTHSMGGLSSRWYLKFLDGTAGVDHWASLGGPNHGTAVAGLCSLLITSCREMLPDSPFLRQLNAGDETPGGVAYGTFWSPCDEIINPDNSVLLDGAANTNVGCVGHLSLLINNNVSQLTRDFLLNE